MMSRRLLGQDHDEYGTVTTVAVGERAAASISVGGDPNSPSLQFKGFSEIPNEDALCVVDNGDLIAMAVADAHFGHEASHWLIDDLHAFVANSMPVNASGLVTAVENSAHGSDPETGSRSTLLVALFDRRAGRGWVVNFGDSTLAVVTATGDFHQTNVKDDRYVAGGDLWPAGMCSVTEFTAEVGDTLLMFTDGVDECHYRHPATSVRPHHIVDLVGRHTASPATLSNELASMALTGVDGNPGGQDNIAIIAAQA